VAAGNPVTVFDNLSSGSADQVADGARLIEGDLKDLEALRAAVAGHEHVFHFAANPDIARAVTEPAIDFWEGTYLHHNVLEACRAEGVRRITYASGSGVYGDQGDAVADEDAARTEVVSTYAASKLGCEALLAAYCHMFGLHGAAFRFANVVGDGQTHGVTYDFVRKLHADPTRLEILGDGRQSKSYIHVDDVVEAVLLAGRAAESPFDVYNVATGDYVTVTEIAEIATEVVGIDGGATAFEYTGGARGWKGDVPVVRINTDKIRALGWKNERTGRQALTDSMSSMVLDARAGRFA
jgi:UDP-glucose 4-epimerase